MGETGVGGPFGYYMREIKMSGQNSTWEANMNGFNDRREQNGKLTDRKYRREQNWKRARLNTESGALNRGPGVHVNSWWAKDWDTFPSPFP